MSNKTIASTSKYQSIASESVKVFLAHPIFFAVLRLPELIPDALYKWFEPVSEKAPLWQTIALTMPYIAISIITSIFCTSAVFATVKAGKKTKPSYRHALESVKKRAGTLALAALIVGLVCAIGVFACVIPGLILIGLYLFVPHLIMSEGRLPVMVYLNRSWKIATRNRGYVSLIIFMTVTLSIAMYFAGSLLPQATAPESVIAAVAKSLVTVLISAFMDVWMAVSFIRFQHESENR